jgi:hypothetical protein
VTERTDPLGLALVLPDIRATLAIAITRARTALLGLLQGAEQALDGAGQALHAGAGTDDTMQFMVVVLQAMARWTLSRSSTSSTSMEARAVVRRNSTRGGA